MKFLPSKTTTIVLSIVVAFLSFWGYCYEYAYFARMGLKVGDYLSFKYYFYSGATSIIPLLILLFVFVSVKRLFTKDIHVDPMEAASILLKPDTFPAHVAVARVGFLLSLFFAICVFIPPIFKWNVEVWFVYLYVVLMVLQTFFGALATSPPHARISLILAFIISVAFCFAAGGYGAAGSQQFLKDGAVRDDSIVRVVRPKEGKAEVQVKPLTLPLPAQLQFFEDLTKGTK